MNRGAYKWKRTNEKMSCVIEIIVVAVGVKEKTLTLWLYLLTNKIFMYSIME
jgi:hypothetical protein